MKTLNSFLEKYPYAFVNRLDKAPFHLFGFECGDGWYDILDPVISWINNHNEKNPNERITISQIKEKYGTLRFYTLTVTEELDQLIQHAENESEKVCEQCGSPGKVRGKGWIYVACDKHTKN